MLRKKTIRILITLLLIIEIMQLYFVYAPCFVNVSSASYNIESLITNSPPNIDGVVSENEWDYAPSIILQHGFMMFQNDASNFYILLDLTGDTVDDPLISEAPWGDYFSISFDVDTNSEIDNIDVKYGIHPITHELGISFYQGPGMTTTIHDTKSYLAKGFGASINSMNEHRIWELAIDLEEINADPGSLIKFGLRTSSQNPEFTELLPENLDQTFISFIPIELAKSKEISTNPEEVTTTIKPSSKDSTIMYGHSQWLEADLNYVNVGNIESRGLIQFDLSSIPQGSKVSSATLRLYSFPSSENPVESARTHFAYKVTQSWTEEGATWDKYDGINEWSTPGGDYTTSGGSFVRIPSNQDFWDRAYWMMWDVTFIMRDWIEEGQPNYGFLIKDLDEDPSARERHDYIEVYYSSRDVSLSDYHPELIISYIPVSPTIKIYVKDTSGNPINRAEVTSLTQPSGQTTLVGNTGPEGSVTFEEVKSGSYTFLASSEEYESNSESITVSRGENMEKTILLEKKQWEIPSFPLESLLLGSTLVIIYLWFRK